MNNFNLFLYSIINNTDNTGFSEYIYGYNTLQLIKNKNIKNYCIYLNNKNIIINYYKSLLITNEDDKQFNILYDNIFYDKSIKHFLAFNKEPIIKDNIINSSNIINDINKCFDIDYNKDDDKDVIDNNKDNTDKDKDYKYNDIDNNMDDIDFHYKCINNNFNKKLEDYNYDEYDDYEYESYKSDNESIIYDNDINDDNYEVVIFNDENIIIECNDTNDSNIVNYDDITD